MSFIFLLRTTFYSLAAFLRKILFFTLSTIKFISSHHRVISSLSHGLRELITSLAMHASLVISRNTTWLCGMIMVLLTLLLCKYFGHFPSQFMFIVLQGTSWYCSFVTTFLHISRTFCLRRPHISWLREFSEAMICNVCLSLVYLTCLAILVDTVQQICCYKTTEKNQDTYVALVMRKLLAGYLQFYLGENDLKITK